MCGITGIYSFNEAGRFHLINLQKSMDILSHRGPDSQGSYFDNKVGLGHRRLAVIDTSSSANQPMYDKSGRYIIIFNGEIYNYRELRSKLEQKFKISFSTQSDTEVLLYLYIKFGRKCLDQLNGFFAFAVYDKDRKELFIARDRFGIKPLYYFQDDDKFLFASELRSIIGFGIEKNINIQSLWIYLQLNYVPGPYSMLNGVHKLLPGHFIFIRNNRVKIEKYYDLPVAKQPVFTTYSDQKKKVLELLERAVVDRLVADVPLGIFLSGGIDSSLITALASRNKQHIQSFSIGYSDNQYFDETEYARKVAEYFKTDHHIFNLQIRDLYDNLHDILNHLDEPFADSSAIPVYLLSKLTRRHVTVALSGDGADEVFSGYNKHQAFFRSGQKLFLNQLAKTFLPLWKVMPKSRNNYLTDRFRQIHRYGMGLKLDPKGRYWLWASLMSSNQAAGLLADQPGDQIDRDEFTGFKEVITGHISSEFRIKEILHTDTLFVLPNDMLYKVDLMSMAHSLEVRVPFLDASLVEYAFSLPDKSKIMPGRQKIILRDILHELLPGELYKRPKHGFEVPLLGWFRNELKSLIKNELLEDEFVREQGIFNVSRVKKLKKKLFGINPGDTHANIWALIVFQWWWKKYLS